MSSRSFPLTIQRFVGPRSQIRVFFELADDSRREIDAYIDAGEVLVARRRDEVVGHVLFISYGVQWEIKSIAVEPQHQREGIGTALVRSVLQRAELEGCIQVVNRRVMRTSRPWLSRRCTSTFACAIGLSG